MAGQLNGFPTKVPITAAGMLTRNRKASAPASIVWMPTKGVHAAKMPTAQPSATSCGVARTLMIRRQKRISRSCTPRRQELTTRPISTATVDFMLTPQTCLRPAGKASATPIFAGL